MMACSPESYEGQPSDATSGLVIAFVGQLQEKHAVTRSSALSDELTTFRIFAYKNDGYAEGSYTSYQTVINDYTASWTGDGSPTTSNSRGWEYVNGTTQTIKYWDMSARAYRFLGYAPATAAVTTDMSADRRTFTMTANATTAETIAATPYYTELWFSTGNPADYPDRQFGTPVELKFLKPFALVRFMFAFAADCQFTRSSLTNISLKPIDNTSIATNGTFTVTYPLKGSATAESWAVTSITDGISTMTDDYYEGHERWYTVLPTASQPAYQLSLTANGETRTASIPAQMVVWEPGYQYTYIFKFTDAGSLELAQMQVATRDWMYSEADDINHSMYNW